MCLSVCLSVCLFVCLCVVCLFLRCTGHSLLLKHVLIPLLVFVFAVLILKNVPILHLVFVFARAARGYESTAQAIHRAERAARYS